FVRLRSMLDAVVAESHVAMERNTDRTKAFDLQMAWRERKVFLDFIDSYISVIAAKRQDTVRELLANLGLDPERIEQHVNMSTQDLRRLPPGVTAPPAPSAAPTQPQTPQPVQQADGTFVLALPTGQRYTGRTAEEVHQHLINSQISGSQELTRLRTEMDRM